jgi:hypothetical protein
LRQSKYDKEKADRAKGVYPFTKKTYVNYHSDASVRPPYYLTWCRYNPQNGLRELNEWKIKWNFSPVTTNDDYVPEGVTPNAEGLYVFGDLVFVKCPIQDYINKRRHEMRVSENAPKAIQKQFQAEAKSYGVDLDDEQLEKMLRNRG